MNGRMKAKPSTGKDENSTSANHGFRIVGYKLMDSNNEIESYYKNPFKTFEETNEKIKQFFIKSYDNYEPVYCKDSVKKAINFLDNLQALFENKEWIYEVRGASLLIAVDH